MLVVNRNAFTSNIPTPDARRRILHVLTLASRTGRYGGPYDVAATQVKILNQYGLKAILLCGVTVGDEPKESRAVPTIAARVRRIFPGPELCVLFSARMLCLLLRNIRAATTVHVHLGREMIPLFAAALALIFSRKLVVQTHGMIVEDERLLVRILDSFVTRRVVSRADLIVVLTETEGADLSQWLGKALPETLTLGNGVDLMSLPKPIERPDPDNEVLFMARLHPRKRATDFVQAARDALAIGSDARYVAVGPDGGDLAQIQKLAIGLGNFDICPPVAPSEVVQRLSSARIFVQCSTNEPWGNVLVTALSLGIPCIATASATLAPAIKEYQAGIVVPDESPCDIASATDEILRDPVLWRRLSEGAVRLSQAQFDLKILGHRLVDAHRRL
jgi:glycosyltransferase involved in cell wall biosynthesis